MSTMATHRKTISMMSLMRLYALRAPKAAAAPENTVPITVGALASASAASAMNTMTASMSWLRMSASTSNSSWAPSAASSYDSASAPR